MGKVINKGVAKLGEVGLLGPSIMTGANLCQRPPKKPKAPEPEASNDNNPDPLSASTPKEAMALAIKFLEGLKPPEPKEEPEVEKEPPKE
jgi:hypothetical protein